MQGLGCGCNGSTRPLEEMGNSGAYGYPTAFDGMPMSIDLPGYYAVTGSEPGFDAPSTSGGGAVDSSVGTGIVSQTLNTPVFGCPAWVWLLAGAMVMVDHKRGRR